MQILNAKDFVKSAVLFITFYKLVILKFKLLSTKVFEFSLYEFRFGFEPVKTYLTYRAVFELESFLPYGRNYKNGTRETLIKNHHRRFQSALQVVL